MAEISISIAQLFEETFGYKISAFKPVFNPVVSSAPGHGVARKEVGVYGSNYYACDERLGMEYFMPVKISWPDKSGAGSNATMKEWDLPYPVISISSRKTIVETPLTERRGTVKELISIEDYEIVIKGFIINRLNEFPESDVITLRSLYEQNSAVSIKCPLTDIFLLRPDRNGSDQVVIRDLKFPQVTGIKNVRPYELHMVSDEPFNMTTINQVTKQ